MSNRIGNQCHCSESYSPPTQTDRGREARAARQAARQQQPRPLAPPVQPSKLNAAEVSFRSEESAALEVKTADGDTVKISFAAVAQAKAGAYSASASADGSNASAQTFSGGTAYSVKVSVDGSLDDKETAQIGDLLQKLVTASRDLAGGADRSSSPGQQAGGSSSFDTLSSFSYGYRAYQEYSQSTLSAQAA